MYQPDAIANFRSKGKTFLITANEGDARDYDGFAEEKRVSDLLLDPAAFPNAVMLQEDKNLGRLTVTSANGDEDNDGDFDQLFSFGARSFSIWTETGELVFDSGDALEAVTASTFPSEFNSNNDENGSFDSVSDNKGPEPEGVITAKIYGKQYAFIGLERIGGILIYDVTDATQPEFIEYVNNRDFSGDAEAGTAGDLGPEGLLFIKQSDSHTKNPLLIVANEVSGSTTVHEIKEIK